GVVLQRQSAVIATRSRWIVGLKQEEIEIGARDTMRKRSENGGIEFNIDFLIRLKSNAAYSEAVLPQVLWRRDLSYVIGYGCGTQHATKKQSAAQYDRMK